MPRLYASMLIVLLLNACTSNTAINPITGITMGTTYSVQQPDGRAVSKRQIEERLQQINAIFSTWDSNSELSLLNQSPINQWTPISNELFFVLAESKKLQQQTAGYFDPGIGRLIDIWGFGTAQIQQKPSRTQVHEALKNTGIRYLEFKEGQVKKTKDIRLDLSAIAKGYALDEIAKLLGQNNSQNFLIEIGGEVIARGKNGNKDWVLGIQSPNNAQPIVIKLTNQAIATSGNYRHYFIWEGVRYMHILVPNTGLPANTDLASVSVLHAQTMMADAYATAMMAMGSEQSIALAKRFNLSVVLVLNQQHNFKVINIKASQKIKRAPLNL